MNRSLWLLVAVCVSACGASGPPAHPPVPEYPGKLAPVSALGADFTMRQRITFTRGETTRSMDVAVEKHGDELRVLGLTPMGTRAYFIRQVEGEIAEVKVFLPSPPPVPPRFVLLDLERVLAQWPAVSEEVVTEDRRDGLLTRRTFRRADAHPPGDIVIDYGAGMGDAPPPEIRLKNPWLGYELLITTTEFRRDLPRNATPSGS